MPTLNEVYSSLDARRRCEVWFLRVGLADGSGAWLRRLAKFEPFNAIALRECIARKVIESGKYQVV